MAEAFPKKDGVPFAREYQLELLDAAIKQNIIICLGTGTGKTFISIKLIEYCSREDDIQRPFSEGAKRTFFLVNSVPLVTQQAKAIRDCTSLEVEEFCGEMGVDFWGKGDWLKKFEENHVLVMTAQIFLDLIETAKLKLSQVNLLVFDECHHANKKHPFKRIMDFFDFVPSKDHPKILGLTASVVGRKVKPSQIIPEIRKLECTMRSICKTAKDSCVVEKYGAKPKEYMKRYRSSTGKNDHVALYLEQEFLSVLKPLEEFLCDIKVVKEVTESDLEKSIDLAKGALRNCISALEDVGVWAVYEVSLMIIDDLVKHCKRIKNSLSQTKFARLILEATISILQELCLLYQEFCLANVHGNQIIILEYLKPKVKALLKLLTKSKHDQDTICFIIFVEKRYTACVISKLINTLAEMQPNVYDEICADFITGHGSSDLIGMSHTEMNFKEQNEKLKKFRAGEVNVLVGTSVVEEGVDVPKCNLVVMFDFPKNYRAFVQSRGRGRAKNAKYFMLVSREEYKMRKQEQEMYLKVDEYLLEICQQEDRDEPTEEEIYDAMNVDSIEPEMSEINAQLNMGNSVSRLYRYCSKLPCDRFTKLSPKFSIHDIPDDKYQCTLKMPGNSHITQIVTGEPMSSKKEARQAVALEACKLLYKLGGLNEHFLPTAVESSSESETDDVDGSTKHKTGTKKNKRSHPIKRSSQVYESRLIANNKSVYVYKIIMSMKEPVYDEVKKSIWNRKNVTLGIITSQKFPSELPTFPMYSDISELTISIKYHCMATLTKENFELAVWFHRFLFEETLKFSLLPTKLGCRVVLLNQKSNTGPSITGIDFDGMRSLQERESNRQEKDSSDTDLLDSLFNQVDSVGKSNDFMVLSQTDLTPQSPFPNPDKASTFQEYHEKTHNVVITDPFQKLIEVIHFSRKIDHRKNVRGSNTRSVLEKKKKKKYKILLIPEILTCLPTPLSLALRAVLLPVILYRVDSFILMLELRGTVSSELPICEVGYLESPRKRKRISSESLFSVGELKSKLPEYFSDPYSVDTLPIGLLLQAMTFAKSGEDFDLERLEMLGDSFLKMAVSIHVYWHKDHKDEGKLTKYRTRQISNKNLFKLACEKGLQKYVKSRTITEETWLPPGFTSRKEENSNSFSDDDIIEEQMISDKSIADSMEALIGAHLVHCGYIGALQFMTWLGVEAFCENNEESDQLTNGNRRKSPVLQKPSKYANYPLPNLEIPLDEEKVQYEHILSQQTKEMASFEKSIGYAFENKVLLLEAFTHPTFTDNTITGSYQRLEFLGDAVLDFLITTHIYNACQANLTPGQLTDLRSALVNNNIFAVIAVENDYHKFVKEYSPVLFNSIRHFVQGLEKFKSNLSNEEVIPDPFGIPVPNDMDDVECIEAPKPLGDVFESVAGAIFLDSGLDVQSVWSVCRPMMQKYIDEYSDNLPKNPIRLVREHDENATFSSAKVNKDSDRISCILTMNGIQYEGVGRNKHNAKLSAAWKALNTTGNQRTNGG